MNNDAVQIHNNALKMGPVTIEFQRTLRIPESGVHPLPPSLGEFPLRRVADYPDTVPAEWLEHGGVMLPVYQREAMWLSFSSGEPAALQVGVGKVCAISGDRWQEKLRGQRQNYVPLPEQPWLDGINSGEGVVRQFVAAPLGSGATVEGQVTGEEVHGGVQLRVVGATEAAIIHSVMHPRMIIQPMAACGALPADDAAMGLGAGGTMRQEIYEDTRKLKDYDPDRSWRVFVHLCSAEQWTAITGEEAPSTPVDRGAYVRHGFPWFDYYDANGTDLTPSEKLAAVKTVGDVLGVDDGPFAPVDPKTVVVLKDIGSDVVVDGAW